ncbi:class I SAM-dependent methyltransferase [Paenibacillus silviterrae]|uniref:class I SAM-dependent methyltransferase n=1 Tax=Paenibacillus silviterrae TaxID=3242194 RepID=UPI0025434D50|nr:class I SAM-dependent methyltransferase [Paenibacillus chinjuensis]
MSDWFTKSFGSDYMIVYKHRDLQGAYDEVRKMMEWLELPEGSEVLDLCCGMGRHSMALRDFGFRVTGVDLSGVLLEEAKRLDAGGEVRWLQGDMRAVPLDESFDAVVNLFTSFGYFDEDAQNEKVLGEIHRLLGPAGRFIIDYLNPDEVKRTLVPLSERTDADLAIKEMRRIEDGFVRKTIEIKDQETGELRTYEEQVKLYDSKAFLAMLERAGLQVEQLYGGYDASSYDAATSKRMIFVGRKGQA